MIYITQIEYLYEGISQYYPTMIKKLSTDYKKMYIDDQIL